ncbi:MAG: hypothetical protein M1358_17205, partial [Chloroflexi bacterium]|nr:hypothetical protein [Chloroflexota bacterium]
DDTNEIYAHFSGSQSGTHYYYWMYLAALDAQGRLSGFVGDGAAWGGGDSLDRTSPNVPAPTVYPTNWYNGSFSFSWANPGDVWFGQNNIAGYNWHAGHEHEVRILPEEFNAG